MPRFTIIMPTHDHGRLISDSIDSIFAQQVSDFDLFIVGDGATEETKTIVDQALNADRRARFFDLPKEERRCARNRHTALLSADSEFVCYIDDDDLWQPNHLAVMAEVLKDADFGHSRLLMVAPNFEVWSFQDTLSDEATRNRMVTERFNFVSPTTAGHRLAAYRRLPEGWAPPTDDIWNDLNMWRKFLSAPDMRFRSDRRFTCIHLPTSAREYASVDDRIGETKFWKAAIQDEGVRDRIDRIFRDEREAPFPGMVHENPLAWGVPLAAVIGLEAWIDG